MEFTNILGMPLLDGLTFVHDSLVGYDLKKHIKLIAAGKIFSGYHMARALALGADLCNSARAMMLALGCIQSLKCNKNTCPTGVTTHDPRLQKGLVPEDKAERVYRYATTVKKEVATLAHSCGVPEPRRLQRFHCRIVGADGQSRPLDELYPEPEPLELDALRAAARS